MVSTKAKMFQHPPNCQCCTNSSHHKVQVDRFAPLIYNFLETKLQIIQSKSNSSNYSNQCVTFRPMHRIRKNITQHNPNSFKIIQNPKKKKESNFPLSPANEIMKFQNPKKKKIKLSSLPRKTKSRNFISPFQSTQTSPKKKKIHLPNQIELEEKYPAVTERRFRERTHHHHFYVCDDFFISFA